MILEKDYGEIEVNGSVWKLKSSFHSHEPRGQNIQRNTLTKQKLSDLLQIDTDKINFNEKLVITWKHSNDKYRGILVAFNENSKTIILIKSILSNNDSRDKIFKKEKQRINK
jgi:hypothetical protein